MQILITGACGFIGLRLIARLRQNDIKIRAFCRQFTPSLKGDEVEKVQVDLLSKQVGLSELCNGCQCVVYLGPKVHDRSAGDASCRVLNYTGPHRPGQVVAGAVFHILFSSAPSRLIVRVMVVLNALQ